MAHQVPVGKVIQDKSGLWSWTVQLESDHQTPTTYFRNHARILVLKRLQFTEQIIALPAARCDGVAVNEVQYLQGHVARKLVIGKRAAVDQIEVSAISIAIDQQR